MMENEQRQQGLYEKAFEHDACGVGLVANMDNVATREVVEDGLTVLKRLMHRGATGNDPETGDGAGLLLQIPDAFFRKVVKGLPPAGKYAVAMIFGAVKEEALLETIAKTNGVGIICWRDVPTNPSAIGVTARETMPKIRQLFLECGDERRLYIVRREMEKTLQNGYICSLSSRTIVYKGLLLAPQVEKFYPDLADSDFTSTIALVHQRYSTNTFPTWDLAHPFRMLAHNGEINTLKGNLNALKAREKDLSSPVFGTEIKKLLPLIREGQSDSASLDNMFELLVAAGRDPAHAMLMLMPQAWGAKYHMGHDVRGFYEYHSALMEPWDGPAAVAFTDGITAGAALDRNGLRPARWTLTRKRLFILASETGVIDVPPEDVVRHGRLKPGSMVYLDLPNHRLLEDSEIKVKYARRRPYRRWVEENRIAIQGLFTEVVPPSVGKNLVERQQYFGYTSEDLEIVLSAMAKDGKEPVGSMGNDAALACLSNHPRTLFDYFHQVFAQVTNPPIDPIREELVMSLMTYIGNQGNILEESPSHANLIKLRRPVLTEDELHRIEASCSDKFPSQTLPIFFEGDLEVALEQLGSKAVSAVGSGAKIIVLSDKSQLNSGNLAAMPSLLAVAAVNRALIDAGIRSSVGLIIQTGEVREVHHYAVLLGYGATAINPYLALESVCALFPKDPVTAASNYIKAVDKGLLKIMSKMGISTLRSYRSAQMFECVGLAKNVIDKCFPGTPSRVGGLDFADLEARCRQLERSMPKGGLLAAGGLYRYRKGAEDHLWTPSALSNFRIGVRSGDYEKFQAYTREIDDQSRRSCTLRGLIRFKSVQPVPVEEVESVESIMKHFVGGAMSLGSLSPEAHSAISRAFNSIGSMSNCGEGGENSERFATDANCGIKQVASGRFGVTIEYLRAAKDLQIKLAQGAKPGEGGQLPAHKVNDFVAKLRHARAGTTLISPPPHHDIYSIEDLAQLIYDLKCANPKARISVKLVSEAGVGTIAAGVAKAHADVVLVSGFDGGTGASPLTSMKHAGLPWELGLAEAQQTLVKNELRGRVKLQVDGQLKTGRDIVIGAILGAEEFGFGTTLLVALGCIQDRRCHCDTCPVGIATQRECLRKKFTGKKEDVVTFLRFMAMEVREHLAALGLRSLEEAIGRTDLLEKNESLERAAGFDFTRIFAQEHGSHLHFAAGANPYVFDNYDRHELIPALSAVQTNAKPHLSLERQITNVQRTIGTELSGEITSRYGAHTLEEGAITVNFTGVAGQSFGAFLAKGIVFDLKGEANDFVGKGISGGTIVVRPAIDPAKYDELGFKPEDNMIAGNVIAYGGTEGKIFLNGQSGERFAIRNSGVTLVTEGVGDHGCEYMTGGKVVVLGPTGVNFGAGMTGGTAYVLDQAGDFDLRCNLDSIDLTTIEAGSDDESELVALIREHASRTASPLAQRILENWTSYRPRFVKVVPVKE